EIDLLCAVVRTGWFGVDLLRFFFFFQAEDGIRDWSVTGVQTCALPISGVAATAITPKPLSSTRTRRRSVAATPGVRPTCRTDRRSEERRVGKEWRSRWGAEE